MPRAKNEYENNWSLNSTTPTFTLSKESSNYFTWELKSIKDTNGDVMQLHTTYTKYTNKGKKGNKKQRDENKPPWQCHHCKNHKKNKIKDRWPTMVSRKKKRILIKLPSTWQPIAPSAQKNVCSHLKEGKQPHTQHLLVNKNDIQYKKTHFLEVEHDIFHTLWGGKAQGQHQSPLKWRRKWLDN